MKKNFRAFCENTKAYNELKVMGLLEAVKRSSYAKYFKGKLAFDCSMYTGSVSSHLIGKAAINIHLLKNWALSAGKSANIDAIVDYWTSYDGDKSEAHKVALKEFFAKRSI